MPDSVAQQIFNALTTRLEQITVANGYNNDPEIFKGRRSFTWRVGSPVRITVWSPEASPPEERHAERIDVSLTVMVEGFAEDGGTNPFDTALKMIADIKKAVLGPDDQTLGGLVSAMGWAGDGVHMPEEGSKIVSAQVGLVIEYPELRGDPYTVI